nr:immunoglobulin heavy chain junction region [Mus musculus]
CATNYGYDVRAWFAYW